MLIEPGTLDVEQLKTGDAARQRERIDRELGDRLIGPRVGLVIQDVRRAVSDLQEVDVPCDDARAA